MIKDKPLVSIIIATKNEEKHIGNCLESIKSQIYPHEKLEIVVVDNNSTDRTKEIVKKYTENVFNRGSKRSIQLNYGVKKSMGKYILYPDADMILSEHVISECVNACENDNYVGLYIPEIVIGNGYWGRVRSFERSFYNATCIDAVRFVKRNTYIDLNGFDEDIEFGADDWDFSRRINEKGKVDIIKSALYHNEKQFKIKEYIKKKRYYSKNIDKYINKWGNDDPVIKKQFSLWYRFFGVFIENGGWKKLILNPFLVLGLYYLRINVGFQYLRTKYEQL